MHFRRMIVALCVVAGAIAAAAYWIGGGTNGNDVSPAPEVAARLDLLRGPTECPPRAEGSTLVGGCDRRPFPTSPSFIGSLDILGTSAGQLTVVGWAGDAAWFQPARGVLILIDDQARLWAPVNQDRPDVAAHFGRESMRRVAYVLRVPAEHPEAILPRLRVFAVSQEGAVTELKKGPHTRYQ